MMGNSSQTIKNINKQYQQLEGKHQENIDKGKYTGRKEHISENEHNGQKNEEHTNENQKKQLTFKDATLIMRDFVRQRQWEKYHTPRNLVMAMVGEVGEISEIFQWKGEVQNGLKGFSQAQKTHVGEQISDVMCYLLRLADVSGIDIQEALLRKIQKNRQKYPKDIVKGNTDLIQKYKKAKWNTNQKQNPLDKPNQQ